MQISIQKSIILFNLKKFFLFYGDYGLHNLIGRDSSEQRHRVVVENLAPVSSREEVASFSIIYSAAGCRLISMIITLCKDCCSLFDIGGKGRCLHKAS